MATTEIIKPINGLRGLAAMSVVVGHFSPIAAVPAIGVVLFFVISGFLIGRLYLDREFTFANAWGYVVARFARVYPLFATVVVAVGLLNFLVPSADIFELHPDQIVPHLLLAGSGHTIWTISTEFQFYAIFVLIWWAVSTVKSAPIVLFPVLIIAISVTIWLGTSAGRNNLFGYLPIFVLGLLVSYMIGGVAKEPTRWASIALAVSGLCYAVAFFAVPAIYDQRWIYLDPVSVLICVILLASCVTAGDCFINRLLSTRLMMWLGEISFSVYLLHRVAQWITEHTFVTSPDRYTTPIMIALTLAMAQVTNHLIEKPARLKLVAGGRKMARAIKPRERVSVSG